MATKLLKTVTRELVNTSMERRNSKRKTVIVSLEPGDIISFREKRSKRKISVHLGHCIYLADILQSYLDYKSRINEYKQKSKAGYKRLRKPKFSSYPYSKVYFNVLQKSLKLNPENAIDIL